jgi:hypothetical protein
MEKIRRLLRAPIQARHVSALMGLAQAPSSSLNFTTRQLEEGAGPHHLATQSSTAKILTETPLSRKDGHSYSCPHDAGHPSPHVQTDSWSIERVKSHAPLRNNSLNRDLRTRALCLGTCADFESSRFVYRENRVPYYQRLFQNHDGKRQWWKVSEIFPLLWSNMFRELATSQNAGDLGRGA